MRIFPYDISKYIYIIYKNMTIDDIMVPKLYTFELNLENLIRIYSNNENTIIGYNFISFKLVANGIYYIRKYDYKIDNELQIKIDKFREIIKYLLLINNNTSEKIYNKFLINNIL